MSEFKFCQHCGEKIDKECVVCPKCGKQVADLKAEQPNIIINNSNTNTNVTITPNPIMQNLRLTINPICEKKFKVDK